jgi:hypothetical protein
MFRPLRERGGIFPLSSLLLLITLLILVLPASAYSFRIDDPMTEVYYDVINTSGTVVYQDYNSSNIATLETDEHYTILLHTDPLRIASDPSSFLDNMVQYSYAIIFCAFLIFVAGGIAGTLLSVFIRRRV